MNIAQPKQYHTLVTWDCTFRVRKDSFTGFQGMLPGQEFQRLFSDKSLYREYLSMHGEYVELVSTALKEICVGEFSGWD